MHLQYAYITRPLTRHGPRKTDATESRVPYRIICHLSHHPGGQECLASLTSSHVTRLVILVQKCRVSTPTLVGGPVSGGPVRSFPAGFSGDKLTGLRAAEPV